MPRSLYKFCNVYCNPSIPKPKPDYCDSKKRACKTIVNNVSVPNTSDRLTRLKLCIENSLSN